jgi:hypothetical protein
MRADSDKAHQQLVAFIRAHQGSLLQLALGFTLAQLYRNGLGRIVAGYIECELLAGLSRGVRCAGGATV